MSEIRRQHGKCGNTAIRSALPHTRWQPAGRSRGELHVDNALLARWPAAVEGESPGGEGGLRETDSCDSVTRIESGVGDGLSYSSLTGCDARRQFRGSQGEKKRDGDRRANC
jgi:hypothetical protein